MLAEHVAKRPYWHFYGHPYHVAFRRVTRNKTWYLTVASLIIAACLAPGATLMRYLIMLLMTYNGHAWIELFWSWLRVGYSRPYTLLRTHVLRKHYDQVGYFAMCQGSVDDELAYETLNNGSFTEVMDTGEDDDSENASELLSPIAALTDAHIIASVCEEVDLRILPWLLCGDILLGRGTFVVLSALVFAGLHNVMALLNKRDGWSLWVHITVFYVTFIMGFMAAVTMTHFPFWKASLLVILWHFTDNMLTLCLMQCQAYLWIRSLYPTERDLDRARREYAQFTASRSDGHPYMHVRSFLLTRHLIPHLYHRKQM